MDDRAMLSYQVSSTKTLEHNTDEAGESPVASVWRHGRERGLKEHDKRMDQITNALRIKDQRLEDMNATSLTPSQARIANLVKFGKSSKEIAEALNLSVRTIETHRRKIRTKLGLNRHKTNLRSFLDHHTAPSG